MRIFLAASMLFALSCAAAEARTAHYGGVAAEYCNRGGCHQNEHYAEQLKRQQMKLNKLPQQ